MIRAFFGIPIHKSVIVKLWQDTENIRQNLASHARWIKTNKWHITIKFFAAIEAQSLAELAEIVEKMVAEIKPFSISIRKIDLFPKPRSHTIAGYIVPDITLRMLHKSLDNAGETMGLPAENRRFRPHITLAKLDSSVHYIEPILYSSMNINIEEIVLYESKKSDGGSNYIPLRRFKLSDSFP